jgi:hypothetical protein
VTKFVSVSTKIGGPQPVEKYVKQTYDALSNTGINLELVALQITQLPVREQKKFFRLLLNYIDITAASDIFNTAPIPLREVIELSERLITVVNAYYDERDEMQLKVGGM